MNGSIMLTVRRRMVSIMLLSALIPITGWCQSASELLRQTLESAQTSEAVEIADSRLIAVDFLVNFYEGRRFDLAWTDPANVEKVVRALATSGQHGLSPDDFHINTIRLLQEKRVNQPDDAVINAHLDLLLTDGLVAYAYQLVYGKVDPTALTASWNLSRPLLKRAPEDILQDALSDSSLAGVLKSLEPSFPAYRSLKDQLENYRQIVVAGGWPSVPVGPTLRPGDIDPRVAVIRARLTAEFGELPAASGDENAFDETLEESVRRFQKRYALDVDGAVGPRTLRSMNVTAAERVDQIRVNMERTRWIREEATKAKDFVHVNIAGFYVQHFVDRVPAWDTRAIVGAKYHKTPIFAANMKYIVFNPTWTVPRSIILKEMLPKIKADPSYLSSHNYDLVERSGRKVSPASVDWTRVNANNFPYNVVQRPGPRNALGQVKFIFPNSHAVYLHDTPGRQLFDRYERTFSHGCIRTKNPLDLAERLLADQPRWTREAIEQTIERGKTTTVYLTESLRVFILYWTADPTEQGGVRFFEDAYNRDPAVLAALEAPYRRGRAAP